MHTFYTLFFALLIFPQISQAYLDPGLGSLIAQALIGGIAFFMMMLGVFKEKIKSIFHKKPKKQAADKENGNN